VTQSLRVFVNERPVDVPRGATVRDAVGSFDRALAELLATESAYVTDARGLPVDATDPIAEAGAVFRVVVRAQRGPRQLSKEALRRWPKAELHVHLDGCLRPQTMLELAKAQGVRLPADTPDALAVALSVKDAKSLEEYLSKYQYTTASGHIRIGSKVYWSVSYLEDLPIAAGGYAQTGIGIRRPGVHLWFGAGAVPQDQPGFVAKMDLPLTRGFSLLTATRLGHEGSFSIGLSYDWVHAGKAGSASPAARDSTRAP